MVGSVVTIVVRARVVEVAVGSLWSTFDTVEQRLSLRRVRGGAEIRVYDRRWHTGHHTLRTSAHHLCEKTKELRLLLRGELMGRCRLVLIS